LIPEVFGHTAVGPPGGTLGFLRELSKIRSVPNQAKIRSVPILELRDVCKAYGNRRILDGVSLTVQRGEYVAIVGESGVGKSTLLNLVAGLDVPDTGEVRLEATDLARLDDDARTRVRRARMGFVFQAFHLLPHLSVARNVALPLALNGQAGPAADARVNELLEAIGLADRATSLPRELSGGEMQRVAVARALAHRPALVLADEPTGNLDPENAAAMLEVLRAQIKRDDAAGILVTHSATAAASTDRVYELTRTGLALRAS
jgi:putative ABC transport system ATP-binding protein